MTLQGGLHGALMFESGPREPSPRGACKGSLGSEAGQRDRWLKRRCFMAFHPTSPASLDAPALAEASEASWMPDSLPALTFLQQPQQSALPRTGPERWEVLTHLCPSEFPLPCQVFSSQLPNTTPPWGERHCFFCFSISDFSLMLRF